MQPDRILRLCQRTSAHSVAPRPAGFVFNGNFGTSAPNDPQITLMMPSKVPHMDMTKLPPNHKYRPF